MKPGARACVVALVLGSTFVTTAHAAIPDSNSVIHGCYQIVTGATRVIGTAGDVTEHTTARRIGQIVVRTAKK